MCTCRSTAKRARTLTQTSLPSEASGEGGYTFILFRLVKC